MNAKILVADESPTIHKIVAMAFENEGMIVEGISKGEHVLEYMVGFKPDIVLADIHLPGIDGYQLSRQIKEMERFSSVRVVLLTSDFEDVDEEELKKSRADDTISKPFKSEEILKKVKLQLEAVESAEEPAETEEAEPSPEAETEEAKPAPEWADNDVIQNEFEDIVNRETESETDSNEQTLQEGEILEEDEAPAEETEPVLEEESETITAETDDNGERESESAHEESETGVPGLADIPEEEFQPEIRAASANDDDLDAAFQTVLADPKEDLDDSSGEAQPREPGAKPNLIEETLSFMARHAVEEEPEITPIVEPEEEQAPPSPGDSARPVLIDRIIAEHIDQVSSQLPKDKRQATPASFEQTVRDVLGEVAPKIIRQVIQEEIENIKKSREV
ncbi:MAG: response regulator [Nitrospinota bacterium]|nr:response regulator [Nitrospinota bacterium]